MSDADVDVTFQDQQNINEFSRLNIKKDEKKGVVEKLVKKVQDLDDASEGVLLGDGSPGSIKYVHIYAAFGLHRTNTLQPNRLQNYHWRVVCRHRHGYCK
jgi:hypothetical protein